MATTRDKALEQAIQVVHERLDEVRAPLDDAQAALVFESARWKRSPAGSWSRTSRIRRSHSSATGFGLRLGAL